MVRKDLVHIPLDRYRVDDCAEVTVENKSVLNHELVIDPVTRIEWMI